MPLQPHSNPWLSQVLPLHLFNATQRAGKPAHALFSWRVHMGGCVSCGNVGQDEPHLREQSTHPKHQPAKAPGESYKLIGPPVKTTNGSDSAPSHSSKSAPPYEILHGTIQLARDDCNEVLAASWVPRAPDGSMSKSLHRQIVNQRHLGKHPNVLEFREAGPEL